MKIAALQTVSGTDAQDNLRRARRLLEQAARDGAELAALPEYFCLLGRSERDKLALAEDEGDGPIQRALAQAARDLGLWVVGGTLPLVGPDEGHVYNSTLVWSPAGEQVARYDKIHLFHLNNGAEQFDERRTIAPGADCVDFELVARDGERWRVGLSVCYDLRFPELYRRLSARGADLLLVPSAFTHTTGQAHWETLLKARAIENLAWVAAPAQGGTHENGRRTWGHTMVVDPWGTVVAQQAEGEGVILADIDRETIKSERARLPALEHRRL